MSNEFVGLSSAEATLRSRKFGLNEISSKSIKSNWTILTSQFVSPLVLILVVACGLSTILNEWVEAVAIAIILVLNALIGFFQEYLAEKAIHALKEMAAPRASVLRDKKQSVIPATEIVVGDCLLLEAGDVVGADAKIIESAHLQINESILTGESLPVEKKVEKQVEKQSYQTSVESQLSTKVGVVFMGTGVATGTASTEVTAIGMSTELGKIAKLITTAESPPTPLHVELSKIGNVLLGLCLAVVLLVLLMGWINHSSWADLLIFSISLAVAVVPEGMPAIVTVALALGVRRMAARHVLVRKLPSVETLGSVSVICTDKTGTLTTGQMRVRELSGANHHELLLAAASCCDSELGANEAKNIGDPTEIAILIAAKEQAISKPDIETTNSRQSSHPFDSTRKRMSVWRKDGVLYLKGAVESVIPLCSGLNDQLPKIMAMNQEMTSRGLRALAVATGTRDEEVDLKYLGLIAIADPPREEAKQAIKEAREAGITIVMITGDHPTTAAAIAKELGILNDGDKIEERVHARATPEQKLKIVRDWKARGAIVAMTGDGVNDAPALREAHIGIAMGKNGTEVTRQAADLILTDDHFSTIVTAVKEGRGIYRNIRNAVVYLLAGNFGELIAVLGASAAGLPLPFLASHLLWINLVTDSLPALTLIVEPVSSGVMAVPPREAKDRLIGWPEWSKIGWVGALEGGVVLLLFYFVLKHQGLVQARNLTFSTLVLSQLWRSFSARSKTLTIFELGVMSNLWLVLVFIGTALFQLSLHFIPFTQQVFALNPLSQEDFKLIALVSLITITVIEVRKLLIRWSTKYRQ